MTIAGVEYTIGICRNEPDARRAHLYRGPIHDPGWPMCVHGWNRSDGNGYSIFRNSTIGRGLCQTCMKRAEQGLPPVPPTPHKTKWI